MINEISAGIVLFRRDGDKSLFLLLCYPAGHWDFVKGKVEGNETLRETAIRETREETGILDMRFYDTFEERIRYEFEYDDTLVHKEVVLFLAETKTEQIQLSHEHLDSVWLDYGTAIQTITFDNARDVLDKAYGVLHRSI